MKKLIFAAFLAIAMLPAMAMAVAAPAALSSGPVVNNTCNLDWNEDTAVNQWYIYVGGTLRYQPFRSDTSVPSTGRRRFLMTNLPPQNSFVVTMRALAPGQPISAESAAITITSSTVPTTFVINPPGQAITVVGSFSPVSGTTQNVSVVASVLPPNAATASNQTTQIAQFQFLTTAAALSATEATLADIKASVTGTAKGTASDPVISDATVVGGTISVSQLGTWTNQVIGNIADGSPDSGNPVKVGGQSLLDIGIHNPYGNAQRANAHFDAMGREIVINSPRAGRVKGYQSLTHTGEVTILSAGAASIYHDLVFIFVTNSGNNDNTIQFRDATGGAVDFEVSMASGGGGAVINFAGHGWPQDTAANNWTVQLVNTPTGGGAVKVSVIGMQEK